MSKNDKTGYIYILTNKSFKDKCVKIGYSDKSNLQERVKQLSNTSVPQPFEIYATYEVPKIEGRLPDKKIHNLIQILNPSLRMNPDREFFEIEPSEAYDLLKAIAEIHNTEDKLVRNLNNTYEAGQVNEVEKGYEIEDLFPNGSDEKELYNSMKEIIDATIPGLIPKATKVYVAFKIKGAPKNKVNVLSLWPKNGWIEVVLNAKKGTLHDENGLIYDISNRKWSSEQYAFRYNGTQDINEIASILKQTYEMRIK